MQPNAALPIEQHDTRCATKAPLRHGDRQRPRLGGFIDADREWQPVFLDEGLKACDPITS